MQVEGCQVEETYAQGGRHHKLAAQVHVQLEVAHAVPRAASSGKSLCGLCIDQVALRLVYRGSLLCWQRRETHSTQRRRRHREALDGTSGRLVLVGYDSRAAIGCLHDSDMNGPEGMHVLQRTTGDMDDAEGRGERSVVQTDQERHGAFR